MTFDPHPPRVVRPDKAPPLLMTTAQKLEAIAAAGRAGRGDRALHARAVAVGSGDVRADACWSTGCASPKSGSARIFCSATIAPATSRCCATLGARYGFKAEKIDPVRYKDFVVSSTRIRRLVSEGRVDEAGRAARPSVLHRRHGRARRPARPDDRLSDRQPLHRERAAAAARRLRDDRDDRRRRPCRRSPTSACGRPSTRPGARSIETHIFDFDRDLYGAVDPRRLRAAAARRAGVRVARRAAARRSPPTATGRACSSIAFHCRIPRSCPITSFSSRSTSPASAPFDGMLAELARARARPRRLRAGGDRRSSTGALGARAGRAGRRRARAGCDVQFRAHDGELEIVVVARRRPRLADHLARCRPSVIRCGCTTR